MLEVSASAERHSTFCLFQFYCLSYVRWPGICDLRGNKNLILGFGRRDMIDRNMAADWADGPIERRCVHLWVHLAWRVRSVRVYLCLSVSIWRRKIKIMHKTWRDNIENNTIEKLSWKCDIFSHRDSLGSVICGMWFLSLSGHHKLMSIFCNNAILRLKVFFSYVYEPLPSQRLNASLTRCSAEGQCLLTLFLRIKCQYWLNGWGGASLFVRYDLSYRVAWWDRL